MDNYYNSVSLSKLLIDHDTDTCGNVKLNRKITPIDIKAYVDKGKLLAYRKDKILLFKWMYKRPVSMISTIHVCNFYMTKSCGKPKEKPEAIVFYNHNMYGVDLVDQCM